MKLVFAGTPEFAAIALAALLDAGHEIALVLTQPDRAAGRGLKPQPSAVKLLAQAKHKKKPETNGADVAADILLKALDKPPKKPRGRPKVKV